MPRYQYKKQCTGRVLRFLREHYLNHHLHRRRERVFRGQPVVGQQLDRTVRVREQQRVIDEHDIRLLRLQARAPQMAAVAAGADGLIIEVHTNPENALSDGYQTLNIKTFTELMKKLKELAPVVNKKLNLSTNE